LDKKAEPNVEDGSGRTALDVILEEMNFMEGAREQEKKEVAEAPEAKEKEAERKDSDGEKEEKRRQAQRGGNKPTRTRP